MSNTQNNQVNNPKLDVIHQSAVIMYSARERYEYLKANRSIADKANLRKAKSTLKKAQRATHRAIAQYIDEQSTGPWSRNASHESYRIALRKNVTETLASAQQSALLKTFNTIVEGLEQAE